MTKEIYARTIKGLCTTPQEKEFADLLYNRDEAKEQEAKAYFECRMKEIRVKEGISDISLEYFDLVANWRHSALLEALNLTDLTCGDFAELGKKLGIAESELRSLASQLERVGLIRIDGERPRRLVEGLVSTPDEVRNQALVRLHRQLLVKAKEALHRQGIHERSITGITMAIDPAKIPEAKRRIRAFMRELMGFLEDGERTKVYQLNTQLFELKEDIIKEDEYV